MSDRKYRQKGYQDYEFEKSEKGEKRPQGEKLGGARWQQAQATGPRALQMPGTRRVSRCTACGTLLPLQLDPFGQCQKCGVELHSCKQCAHFDPASRFECSEPIPERIPDKGGRNNCQYYAIRTTVEREASSSTAKPKDARSAFDNLFKK